MSDAAILSLIEAFAEAHRRGALVPDNAPLYQHRAAIVSTDEAYRALVEAIPSPAEVATLRLRLERVAALAEEIEKDECIYPDRLRKEAYRLASKTHAAALRAALEGTT